MSNPQASRRWRSARFGSPLQSAAAIIFFCSLLAIVSWRFDLSIGRSQIYGSRPISPDSALAFLLLGASICCLSKKKALRFQEFTAALLAIGGTLLPVFDSTPYPELFARTLFGLIGIESAGPFPRMAMITGFAFGLSGYGLLSLQLHSAAFKRYSNLITAICGTLVISVGCLCLLNFWVGLPINQDPS